MTTNTAGENTTQPGSESAEGVAGGEQGGSTILGSAGDAGKTAGVAEGGTGAETGAGKGGNDGGEGGDGGNTEGANTDDDAGKADGPPEKYEFTLPDGMAVDEQLASAVEPVFREIGLTNEQANKLAVKFAEWRVSEIQRTSEAYAQQVEDWGKQAREDKEFGGAAFEKNIPLALNALAKFGTPELKSVLEEHGLGNHPEMIRFCVRVGKAMQEDGGVDGSTKTPAAKSIAELLYDHPTSKPK